MSPFVLLVLLAACVGFLAGLFPLSDPTPPAAPLTVTLNYHCRPEFLTRARAVEADLVDARASHLYWVAQLEAGRVPAGDFRLLGSLASQLAFVDAYDKDIGFLRDLYRDC